METKKILRIETSLYLIFAIYTTCFKSWNFSKAGAWNLNQAFAGGEAARIKSQDAGEDKNQLLEYVVYKSS